VTKFASDALKISTEKMDSALSTAKKVVGKGTDSVAVMAGKLGDWAKSQIPSGSTLSLEYFVSRLNTTHTPNETLSKDYFDNNKTIKA
jgi:hypothetical protein